MAALVGIGVLIAFATLFAGVQVTTAHSSKQRLQRLARCITIIIFKARIYVPSCLSQFYFPSSTPNTIQYDYEHFNLCH